MRPLLGDKAKSTHLREDERIVQWGHPPEGLTETRGRALSRGMIPLSCPHKSRRCTPCADDGDSGHGAATEPGGGQRPTGNPSEPVEKVLPGGDGAIRHEVEGASMTAGNDAGQRLGFETLARQWLQVKRGDVSPHTLRSYSVWMHQAARVWGHRNVTEIGAAEIERFLHSRPFGPKTRSSIGDCLRLFWTWLREIRAIPQAQMDAFPADTSDLGGARPLPTTTQEAILEELHRLTWATNPKLWLAARWLCNYPAIHPEELIRIQERDIDLENGRVMILKPSQGRPRAVSLVKEDLELVRELREVYPAPPDVLFFRHTDGLEAGHPFGPDTIDRSWEGACSALGVEGVALRAGPPPPSLHPAAETFCPDPPERTPTHTANKALERYSRVGTGDAHTVHSRSDRGPRRSAKRGEQSAGGSGPGPDRRGPKAGR